MKRQARSRAAATAFVLACAIASCAHVDHTANSAADVAPVDWEQPYAQAIAAYEQAAYADASRLARTAHSLATAALGADTTEAGAALSLQAAAELALGHFPEATAAFESSLATLRRTPGADPRDMAAAMGNLGELHRQQGQLDRALPWYEEAYRTNAATYGPTHPETANALAALALVRHELGALPEAETAYREAMAIMTDAGAPPLQVAKVQANLADLFLRTDRFDEARRMLDGVLALELAHLGPGHPDLAYTLNSQGTVADAQGRHQDALALYQRALDIRRNALPAGHPSIATVLSNMAGAYRDLGAMTQARDSYSQAVAILREAHGDGHPDIADLEAALQALD